LIYLLVRSPIGAAADENVRASDSPIARSDVQSACPGGIRKLAIYEGLWREVTRREA